MKHNLQVAIDGPVGSGKSDISTHLAKELGIVYLYTGAMYRAVSWLCTKFGVPYKDEQAVVTLMQAHSIDLIPPAPGSARTFAVLIDGKDVTEQLFEPGNDQPVSDVSTLKAVRQIMVAKQKELAKDKSVVMEGRDIGYRVLPDADLKIYLTASVEERAKRRLNQWLQKGITGKTLADALVETKKRDEQDMNRTTDPLQKLPDAWELDTTGLSQEEVIQRIKMELKHRNLL